MIIYYSKFCFSGNWSCWSHNFRYVWFKQGSKFEL